MCTGNRIHEVFRVVNVRVYVAVIAKVDVTFPAVCDNRSSGKDVLLDEGSKGRLVAFVSRTRSQKTLVVSSLNATKYPSSFNHASAVELPFSEFSFINFDDSPRT